MSSVKEVIEKCGLYSRTYKYKNNVRILDTKKGKVVIKEKRCDKNEIYNYLLSRDFNHFLLDEKDYNDFEIYPYIESINMSDDARAMDLVIMLSILHIKTTFYKETDLDDIKRIYEEVIERVDYLDKYYHELQDVIESRVFMSPTEYLIIRNISKVYGALLFARRNIEVWYKEVQQQKSSRYVMLHNNVCLDHFLVGKDKSCFISWDKASFGFVIYDFLGFYKKEYLRFDMNRLYDVYQSRYRFTKTEELLFFVLISIPEKISIDNSFNGCVRVHEWVEYIDKSYDLISKQNIKYQKETEKE